MTKVEELIERVKLTPEEINNLRDKELINNWGVGRLIKEAADLATNKVLNDPSIAIRLNKEVSHG